MSEMAALLRTVVNKRAFTKIVLSVEVCEGYNAPIEAIENHYITHSSAQISLMPPIIRVPENVKPWKPIIVHVPAPPPSQLNPDLNRYYEAKKRWKDSTPLYRHKNPRPETWIPKSIIDTNYKIPTAEEILQDRQEYLAIVEEIKDRIPPEYYEHWHDYFSRPVKLDGGPHFQGL
jgi:hypothetical protein